MSLSAFLRTTISTFFCDFFCDFFAISLFCDFFLPCANSNSAALPLQFSSCGKAFCFSVKAFHASFLSTFFAIFFSLPIENSPAFWYNNFAISQYFCSLLFGVFQSKTLAYRFSFSFARSRLCSGVVFFGILWREPCSYGRQSFTGRQV